MELVPPLLERGLKVCDLGADFRLRDPHIYEQWYKLPHTATRVLEEAVYGLPEWNREKIKGAALGRQSGLLSDERDFWRCRRLWRKRLVEPQSIIVDSLRAPAARGAVAFGVGMHHPGSAQRL
jgi:N-acetyl-gamma-glutamyl-phosphate reductase